MGSASSDGARECLGEVAPGMATVGDHTSDSSVEAAYLDGSGSYGRLSSLAAIRSFQEFMQGSNRCLMGLQDCLASGPSKL